MMREAPPWPGAPGLPDQSGAKQFEGGKSVLRLRHQVSSSMMRCSLSMEWCAETDRRARQGGR
jgi:hypothetical protein